MDAKTLVPLAVQGSMMLIVLAVGLQARWKDLTYALDRPGLIARGVLAVNVVVPVLAIALCLAFPIDRLTAAGLIIMAVSPLAPFVPGKMLKSGADSAYTVGLYVALILTSVILVPLTTAIITALLGHDVSVPIAAIGKLIVISILLPLAAGILIGTLAPGLAKSGAKIATVVAYLILLPIALIAIYKAGPRMLALLGDGTLAVIAITVLGAFVAGHMLGGPEPEHRLALAQAAATRHPGIAGLIVHRHFQDPQIMLAVILFLLAGMVLSAIYAAWLKKHSARAAEHPLSA